MHLHRKELLELAQEAPASTTVLEGSGGGPCLTLGGRVEITVSTAGFWQQKQKQHQHQRRFGLQTPQNQEIPSWS